MATALASLVLVTSNALILEKGRETHPAPYPWRQPLRGNGKRCSLTAIQAADRYTEPMSLRPSTIAACVHSLLSSQTPNPLDVYPSRHHHIFSPWSYESDWTSHLDSLSPILTIPLLCCCFFPYCNSAPACLVLRGRGRGAGRGAGGRVAVPPNPHVSGRVDKLVIH